MKSFNSDALLLPGTSTWGQVTHWHCDIWPPVSGLKEWIPHHSWKTPGMVETCWKPLKTTDFMVIFLGDWCPLLNIVYAFRWQVAISGNSEMYADSLWGYSIDITTHFKLYAEIYLELVRYDGMYMFALLFLAFLGCLWKWDTRQMVMFNGKTMINREILGCPILRPPNGTQWAAYPKK